jgi:hypothetical protein
MTQRMPSLLLPTKGIGPDRALITIGSEVLDVLRTPTSVSGLWERFNASRSRSSESTRVTFDWFSLSLASLFSMGLIEWSEDGHLTRSDVH